MPSFQMTQALCLEKLCKTHTHANALIYRYMNKYVKWGIMAVVAVGLTVLGVRNFMPHENAELNEAPKGGKGMRNKVLPVRYYVVKPQALRDAIEVSGSLLPDEEVNLSFEKAGKITEIHFTEGAHVKQGQLLAKINDAPQQAQLRKLEAQLKLMQDRLYRQRALLEKEAVSKGSLSTGRSQLAGTARRNGHGACRNSPNRTARPLRWRGGTAKGEQGYVCHHLDHGGHTDQKLTSETRVQCARTLRRTAETRSRSDIYRRGRPHPTPCQGVCHQLAGRRANPNLHRTRPLSQCRRCPSTGRYVSITLNAREYPNTLAVPATAVISEMGIDKVFFVKTERHSPLK